MHVCDNKHTREVAAKEEAVAEQQLKWIQYVREQWLKRMQSGHSSPKHVRLVLARVTITKRQELGYLYKSNPLLAIYTL